MLTGESNINYNFIVAVHCSKKLYIQSKCYIVPKSCISSQNAPKYGQNCSPKL